MTFIASALLYPCALAAMCVGAGLLVDRLCGGFLPGALLPGIGVAALIALSQLTTFVVALAPATPYLMLAVALLGYVLARERVGVLWRACARRPWEAGAPVLAYALALAPVLLAGRASFSSYMALADSAVHMLGADFILHHGQSYSHLDLRNSYGQFVNDYYNTSYPSGADTLFGGSALLLGLPLIWAFQPFNAFILATAYGPCLLLARRLGLRGAWALAAALTAVLPALVYAYELIGSVKEITALSMLMSSACLVVLHRRWLGGGVGARGSIPLALVLAAGVSALGIAFGAWALVAVLVLAAILLARMRRGRIRPSPAVALIAMAACAGVLAALPSIVDLPGSLRVANTIATTGNSGNLHTPLRAIQVFGIWLGGSYKLAPSGSSLGLTHALIALALLLALAGGARLLALRAFALAAWMALTLLAWLIISHSVTTWADAKTLMITSPSVMLLAWGGVSALRAIPRRALAAPAAALAAAALSLGVLASDELQYRSSNLAPTARYQEMASIDSRFAGRGPALFTDFDEYSLYVLRGLDVGGPDFVYPPSALASAAGGYGDPVDLDRIAPSALAAYPLIVTRRDPLASRPPAAYRLAWQGSYYQVWVRLAGAAPALAHIPLSGSPAHQCGQLRTLAAAAPAGEGVRLLASRAPRAVRIALQASEHPTDWGHQRAGLVMSRPGRLTASFQIPSAGSWQLWVQGQIMPSVTLAVDGRRVQSISGQLSGNSLLPDTVPPIGVRLSAGAHTLSVTRGAFNLAPGDRGSAVLDAVFLTPSSAGPAGVLSAVAPARWAQLCGASYQWAELARTQHASPAGSA